MHFSLVLKYCPTTTSLNPDHTVIPRWGCVTDIPSNPTITPWIYTFPCRLVQPKENIIFTSSSSQLYFSSPSPTSTPTCPSPLQAHLQGTGEEGGGQGREVSPPTTEVTTPQYRTPRPPQYTTLEAAPLDQVYHNTAHNKILCYTIKHNIIHPAII